MQHQLLNFCVKVPLLHPLTLCKLNIFLQELVEIDMLRVFKWLALARDSARTREMKRDHLRGLKNNLALDIILIIGKLCRKATDEVIRIAPPKGFDTDNGGILQELSGFVIEITVPILELHDALSTHYISVRQRRAVDAM